MRTGLIKAPQDFVGGLVVIALALLALWLGADLPRGTPRALGPGMMPTAFAVLLGLLGLALVVTSVTSPGAELEGVSVRGLLFVPAAILVFALTVRPFGLAVAAPLAIGLAAFASAESRPVEVAALVIVMTLACVLLFKFALGLPIPLAPWLIGY